MAAHHKINVGSGQTEVIRLRLSKDSPERKGTPFGQQSDEVSAERLREADESCKSAALPSVDERKPRVIRQVAATKPGPG